MKEPSVQSGLSDWFETTVGVMEGCVLSPLLFDVFLEVIMGRERADHGAKKGIRPFSTHGVREL